MVSISFEVFIMAFVAFVGMAQAANNYPAVLVHGLFGDGDRSKGISWGDETQDVQELMRAEGYEVFTADVGPISSNWDRACELYAQIVGGRVDYGVAHSNRYNHERYGRTYPKLVNTPGFNWGTDADSKVHLIGHSMGGQTVRMLTALLENGDVSERAASGGSVSPLFAGGSNASDFIASQTTMQAPNDGSTLVNVINGFGLLDIVINFAVNRPGFDFQWDHWGCGRSASDSDSDYTRKIKNCRAIDSNDYAAFDVSPDGAAILNARAPAIPDIYQFTYAAYGTKKWWWGKAHNPLRKVMPTILWPTALLIGRNDDLGDIYRENDGIVPTYSQIGPHLRSNDRIVSYNGRSVSKGVWNHMETGVGDHGFRQSESKTLGNIIPFWEDNLMPLLTSLSTSTTTYIAVPPARFEIPAISDDNEECDDTEACAQYITLLEEQLETLGDVVVVSEESSDDSKPSDNAVSSIVAGAGAFAAGALVCAGLMVANEKRRSVQSNSRGNSLARSLTEEAETFDKDTWFNNRLSQVKV